MKFPNLFGWVAPVLRRTEQIIARVCDHPEHLQRLAIIMAGAAVYPVVWALIFIVWKGFDQKVLGAQQLEILGNGLMATQLLWGLVVIALLGIVKGVHIKLPGGSELDVNIDNVGDSAQSTTTIEVNGTLPEAEEVRTVGEYPDEPIKPAS